MMERQAVLDIGPFLPEWGESRASYDIPRGAQKSEINRSFWDGSGTGDGARGPGPDVRSIAPPGADIRHGYLLHALAIFRNLSKLFLACFTAISRKHRQ